MKNFRIYLKNALLFSMVNVIFSASIEAAELNVICENPFPRGGGFFKFDVTFDNLLDSADVISSKISDGKETDIEKSTSTLQVSPSMYRFRWTIVYGQNKDILQRIELEIDRSNLESRATFNMESVVDGNCKVNESAPAVNLI